MTMRMFIIHVYISLQKIAKKLHKNFWNGKKNLWTQSDIKTWATGKEEDLGEKSVVCRPS